MAARCRFHDTVKTALQKDGWTITHDPYPLIQGSLNLAIDLGAQKVVAAQRGDRKIAVEIKSFLSPSKITELYAALGQFIVYRSALEKQEKERDLFLAVPDNIHEDFFTSLFIQEIVQQNQVCLLTYNIEEEAIERWIS